MSQTEELTYKVASDRLESIVRQIEHQSPDVDELTKLVEEAVVLSKYCKSKLTETDKQLSELMAQLQEG